MDRIYSWLQQNPTTNLPILVALIGVTSALLAGFFSIIVYPSLKDAIAALWYWIRGRVSKRIYEESYLDRLINRHRFLPILPTTLVPVTESHVQELDSIYVELGVSGEPGASPQTLAEVLSNSRRILILGDPGAGKTTILQFLTLQFARARRNKPDKNTPNDRRSLKELRSRIKRDFQIAHYPLPIPIFLNRLRTAPDWPITKSIVDAVHEEMQANDMLRETPNGFFNEYIKRGECMFLFDAFDELGTLSAREAVAQRIGELASVSPEGNTFVVTSRIVGYGGELARFGFQTFVVQRLSWDLIRQLVAKWYTALKDSKLTASLLETLSSNQRVAELAVNPMLLSLIVLVQYVRRVIPERRHVLYDECLKILVERRYAPPVVQAEYSKVLPGEEALKIIRDIAYKLHTVRLREIDRRQVEVEIIPSILKSMPLSRASSVDPAEVLRNIEARSQIIVERGLNEAGQPVMAFTHLTFQEYLTAVYLHDAIAKQGEPFTSSTLISFYEDDPEWWEEVALLYAAQLDGLQQKSLFQRIHPRNSA